MKENIFMVILNAVNDVMICSETKLCNHHVLCYSSMKNHSETVNMANVNRVIEFIHNIDTRSLTLVNEVDGLC